MARKKPAVEHRQDLKDITIGTQGMADLLGITARRLQILVKDGTVPSLGRGKFNPNEANQAYITFKEEGAEKRSGSSSMDELRGERALEIRMNRMRKERELITMDEALGFFGEVTGLFVSYLSGLPAEITGVPRERQRLNEIIDRGRQRLADRLLKKRQDFAAGREDPDTEAED